MDNNIIDIIDALKRSKDIKIEYSRIFRVTNLLFKSLSLEESDIQKFSDTIYDNYLDLEKSMNFLQKFLEISLQYLDKDDYDEIVKEFEVLVADNKKLAKDYTEKTKQKQKLLKVKKEIDEITPKIKELNEEIETYKNLDLEKVKEEHKKLQNELDVDYKEQKTILENIVKAKDEKTKLESGNFANKQELLDVLDSIEKTIKLSDEEKKRAKIISDKLKGQTDKFVSLKQELEKNKKELEVYRKHFNEDTTINESIENKEVSVELNKITPILESADKLIKKQIGLEQNIRDSIDNIVKDTK